jgi:hypothetical protein
VISAAQLRWRWLLALDLGLFNLAIVTFALIPPETIVLPEALMMGLSGFCMVGLVSYATPRFRLPGDQWSYLLTGFIGLLSFLSYEALVGDDVPLAYRVGVGLFMLAGSASGYAAHVIDGGRRSPRGPATE